MASRTKEFNELESLQLTDENKHLVKKALENQERNRYKNILPFDKTLVSLPNSDYINASFISPLLPKGDKVKFIATQAPTTNTFESFYEMLWEYNVPIIVMLTKVQEGRILKANCYWSELNTPEQFGDITVKTTSEKFEKLIVSRRFELTKGKETKNVCFFQFLGWPDRGVPKSVDSIKSLITHVESERVNFTRTNNSGDYHIVVHCSAGVGRTGSFISIYTALRYVKLNLKYDIKAIVENLRQQRMLMVQTKAQYEFIYQVVEENQQSVTASFSAAAPCYDKDRVNINFLELTGEFTDDLISIF